MSSIKPMPRIWVKVMLMQLNILSLSQCDSSYASQIAAPLTSMLNISGAVAGATSKETVDVRTGAEVCGDGEVHGLKLKALARLQRPQRLSLCQVRHLSVTTMLVPRWVNRGGEVRVGGIKRLSPEARAKSLRIGLSDLQSEV